MDNIQLWPSLARLKLLHTFTQLIDYILIPPVVALSLAGVEMEGLGVRPGPTNVVIASKLLER